MVSRPLKEHCGEAGCKKCLWRARSILHFSAPDMTHKTLHHICSKWRTKQSMYSAEQSDGSRFLKRVISSTKPWPTCAIFGWNYSDWVCNNHFLYCCVCVLSDLIYSTRDTYSTYTHCANENEEKITQSSTRQHNRGSVTQCGWRWIVVWCPISCFFGRYFEANSLKK